jgi:predicted RNA-binding protein associated with RNAse of E/G family
VVRRRPLAGLDLNTGPSDPDGARFGTGDTVVVRQHRAGRFRAITPTVCVEDGADRTLLYVPHGTTFLAPADADGRVTRTVADEAGITPDRWRDHAALHIVPRGAPFAVMARWGTSFDDFTGYYVNIQEPLRPTAIGFDTMDQTLDVVVDPDRATFTSKDEDELADAAAAGFFGRAEVHAIGAAARRAVSMLSAGCPPFDEPWARWRPDPSWPVPHLPAGWASEPLVPGPWER